MKVIVAIIDLKENLPIPLIPWPLVHPPPILVPTPTNKPATDNKKNEFEIDYRWSGIMGIGNKKTAIVKSVSDNVFCGIRLGGMGVAIGSIIGNELADEI